MEYLHRNSSVRLVHSGCLCIGMGRDDLPGHQIPDQPIAMQHRTFLCVFLQTVTHILDKGKLSISSCF